MEIFPQNESRTLNNILAVANRTGSLMLKCGAEIFRVEDTIRRILLAIPNVDEVHVYVVPSSIFLSMLFEGRPYTYLYRVSSPSINLNKIALLNDFSRNFVSEKNTDYPLALKKLDEIENTVVYSKLFHSLSCGFACGVFALMFNGNLLDAMFASLSGFLLITMVKKLGQNNINFFLTDFVGALFAGLYANIIALFLPQINIDTVIIGPLMLLVPGIALTNSIRDTMSGDFISGLSKLSEVVFASLAVALGVLIALKIFNGGIFS